MAVSRANKRVNKLLEYTPKEISQMSYNELAPIVKELSNYANKRITALRKKRLTESPAYVKIRESGRNRFTERQKTVNQLRNEYITIRQFLNNKTSTIPQAKKYYKRIKEITGLSLSNTQIRSLWNVYQRLKEYNPSFVEEHSSDRVISLIVSKIDRKLDIDEIFEKVKDLVDEVEYKEFDSEYKINDEDVINFSNE